MKLATKKIVIVLTVHPLPALSTCIVSAFWPVTAIAAYLDAMLRSLRLLLSQLRP